MEIVFRDMDHYLKVVRFMEESFGENWGFMSHQLKGIGGTIVQPATIIVDDSAHEDVELLFMQALLM